MADEKPSKDSAKQALADYYDDIFGSMSGSPLDAKNEQGTSPERIDKLSSSGAQGSEKEASASQVPNRRKDDLSAMQSVSNSSATYSAAFDAEPEASKAARVKLLSESTPPPKVSLKELPETKPSPVIPGATPKLAPPKLAPKPVLQEEAKPVRKDVPLVKPVVQVKEELQTHSAPEVNEQKQATTTETAAQSLGTPAPEANSAPKAWLENGRPEWAQGRFECLLFTVAGLKLAVPLVSLGSIHRIEREFTPLVGRIDWFLGLYQTGDRNIRTVDTAKWVMPKQYHDKVIEGYKFIIRLGDSDWGVACDSVEQAIQLRPDQVKWRTERSKRSWLSGTVIDHMCALLDADMLNFLLQQDANKRRI